MTYRPEDLPKKVVKKVLTVGKGCGHNVYMTTEKQTMTTTTEEQAMAIYPQETIYVAVCSDGLGTYQARCLGCSWVGPWRRKQQAATASAKSHLTHIDPAALARLADEAVAARAAAHTAAHAAETTARNTAEEEAKRIIAEYQADYQAARSAAAYKVQAL